MAELEPRLLAYVDQFTAGMRDQAADGAFERLDEGMFGVAACTSLSDEDATARLNLTPSGTRFGWSLNTDVEPKRCPNYADRRHLFFNC